MLTNLLLALTSARLFSSDAVGKLPGWGDEYTGKMFSGYVEVDKSCSGNLFYWILEKQGGSVVGETPMLLWLNGGPGASSITGLIAENIGPYQITEDGSFKSNPTAWTNNYNVLIIDNPIGAGFSYTNPKNPDCYAGDEETVASQFHAGLVEIFTNVHPEFKTNPFWLTGESYAGKYIPNIAAKLHEESFPFKGVVIGNGLYQADIQYLTVPTFASNMGIVDNIEYARLVTIAQNCTNLIREHKFAISGKYCEDMVGEIYDSPSVGGGVFRYDVRKFSDSFSSITNVMGGWLNQASVQEALHTTGHTWSQSDETGPVADALLTDFDKSVLPQLAELLDANYKVILYNGQMDGSVCNHIGNAEANMNIPWSGQQGYSTTKQELWRVDKDRVVGYKRTYKNFAFVVIVNAGHLVPMDQPENYEVFLTTVINGGLI